MEEDDRARVEQLKERIDTVHRDNDRDRTPVPAAAADAEYSYTDDQDFDDDIPEEISEHVLSARHSDDSHEVGTLKK